MKLSAPTFTKTGGKSKSSTELPESVFAQEYNPELISQAIRVYLSNQRQASRHALTRSQVKKTTAKVWRQKGTGRARHGSRRAPIFVGGGVAHGPTSRDNYTLTMPKKMRRKALASALSHKLSEKQVSIISNLDGIKKTTEAANILSKIASYPDTKKITIIIHESNPDLIRATNNLKGVTITHSQRLNTYETINSDHLLFLPDSIQILANRLEPTQREKSA